MKMIPTERERIYKKINLCKNQKFIEQFYNGEYDCVEVTDYPHKDAKSCSCALRASIRTLHRENSIIAMLRDNRVYLIRKNPEKTHI